MTDLEKHAEADPSHSPDMAEFGNKMRKYRASARMSLDDVAKAASMSKAHVWELEQGRAKNPTVKAVWSIAAALGTTPADMLGIDPNASAADPLAARLANIIRQEMARAIDPATLRTKEGGRG